LVVFAVGLSARLLLMPQTGSLCKSLPDSS
jgi:hypothetical protein